MNNRVDEIKARSDYLQKKHSNAKPIEYINKIEIVAIDKEDVNYLLSDIAYLLEENERLQKVLKFYATESNWTGGWYQEGGNPDAEPDWINPAVDSDGGKLARQTLSVKVDGQ